MRHSTRLERLRSLVDRARWNLQFRPGSYYSPIPSHADLVRRQEAIFAPRRELPGVDLAEGRQLELIEEFRAYYPEFPFTPAPAPPLRYHLDNAYFGYGDGVILYCMLRHFRPRRVVEVGSGFSSALMLDVDERFLGGATEFTFIDPDTSRLDALLSDADRRRHRVLRARVQELGDDAGVFGRLGPGDVLFIDSSHVSKAGSDVNYLLLDVVPALPAGVIVHVHDVFHSFEYPRHWALSGRAWNEAYLVRALLTSSSSLEVLIFNSHLKEFHRDAVAAALPAWEPKLAGSLWLRRT